MARHEKHLRASVSTLGTPEQFQTVDTGHFQVGDEDIDYLFLDLSSCLSRVGKGRQFDSILKVPLNDLLQQTGHARVIIDYEQLRGSPRCVCHGSFFLFVKVIVCGLVVLECLWSPRTMVGRRSNDVISRLIPGRAKRDLAGRRLLGHTEKIGYGDGHGMYDRGDRSWAVTDVWVGKAESLTGIRVAAGQRQNGSDRPLGMSLRGPDFEECVAPQYVFRDSDKTQRSLSDVAGDRGGISSETSMATNVR